MKRNAAIEELNVLQRPLASLCALSLGGRFRLGLDQLASNVWFLHRELEGNRFAMPLAGQVKHHGDPPYGGLFHGFVPVRYGASGEGPIDARPAETDPLSREPGQEPGLVPATRKRDGLAPFQIVRLPSNWQAPKEASLVKGMPGEAPVAESIARVGGRTHSGGWSGNLRPAEGSQASQAMPGRGDLPRLKEPEPAGVSEKLEAVIERFHV